MGEAVNAKTVGLGIFIGIIASVVITVANGDQISPDGPALLELNENVGNMIWVDQLRHDGAQSSWQFHPTAALKVNLDLRLTGPVQNDAPVIESARWTLIVSRNAKSFSDGPIQLNFVAAPHWIHLRNMLDSSHLDAKLLDSSAAALIGSGLQPFAHNGQPTISEVPSIERRVVQSMASAGHSTVLIPKLRHCKVPNLPVEQRATAN